MTTEIWSSRLGAGGRGEGEGEGEGEGGEGGKGEGEEEGWDAPLTPLIKSRDPHLAGGEQTFR